MLVVTKARPPVVERKDVLEATLDLKALATDNGQIKGYGSVFNQIDSVGDTIPPGAFRQTLPAFRRDGFVPWSHDWADPIAMITRAVEDSTGLWIEADFHSDAGAQAKRQIVRERLERGQRVGLSIGFLPKKISYTEIDGRRVRVLEEIQLFEVSVVMVPADSFATVTGAKGRGPVVTRAYERARGAALYREFSRISRVLDWMPPPGEAAFYETDEVDHHELHAAQLVAAQACKDLALPPLRVRWMRPAGAAERAYIDRYGIADFAADGAEDAAPLVLEERTIGFFRPVEPATIWIAAELGARKTAEVAGHEARHCWQNAMGYHASHPHHPQLEVDANQWGARMLSWFEANTIRRN